MDVAPTHGSFSLFLQHLSARHSLTGMDELVWLRWAILLMLWLALAYWSYRQNQAFHDYIRHRRQRTPLSDRLSQLAYNRSFGILLLYAILLLALGYYDTRVHALSQQHSATLTRLDAAETALADLASRPLPQPAPPPSVAAHEALQEALDDLKPRYENLFIHYYTLKHCGLADANDFHLMNSALLQELTHLSANAKIRSGILQAARGSYEELYSGLACDAPEIPAMRQALESYLVNVSSAFPDA